MFLSPIVQHNGAVFTGSSGREGISGSSRADEAEVGESEAGAQNQAAASAENPGAGPQAAGTNLIVLEAEGDAVFIVILKY